MRDSGTAAGEGIVWFTCWGDEEGVLVIDGLGLGLGSGLGSGSVSQSCCRCVMPSSQVDDNIQGVELGRRLQRA